jgi:hypothetical protein
MNEPRWHTKTELTGSVAFYCSDDEGYDRLATDTAKGWWYWTLDLNLTEKSRFFGPYFNRRSAVHALKEAQR